MTPLDSSQTVSVVIATHNRQAILAQALEALELQSWREFDVVVVDDGSVDGTFDWLSSRAGSWTLPRLEILRQERGGAGSARNRGLRFVDGGLVIFLGDDVLLRPDAVAAHVAAHRQHASGQGQESPVAVVGFTDWCRDQIRVTPLLEMIGREGHQFGYGHMTPGEEVPFTCFYTSNLSIPRTALGDDPFKPEFTEYGWEDVELGYRLSRQGLRLFYEPAAEAEHLHPMGLRSVWDRQWLVGHGLGKLLELHPELARSPLLTPPEAPWWFGIGRRLVPGIVPLLDRLDRRNVQLPRAFMHNVLMCAWYSGRQASLEAPDSATAGEG